MRDKYNLNTLPANLAGLEDYEMDEHIVIPGMGIEQPENDYVDQQQMPDMIESSQQDDISVNNDTSDSLENGIIPGLDLDAPTKKPFIKPIPKNFQEQWNVESKSDKSRGSNPVDVLKNVQNVIAKVSERLPGVIKIDEQRPNKVVLYGKEIEIRREYFITFFFCSLIL